MRKMKSKRLFGKFMFVTAVALFSFVHVINAQEQEITDEELKDYAIIQNAVDMITGSISPSVNDLIRRQEGMTGQRFNELRKAGSSEAKLKEAGAQDWEVQFMSRVNKMIDDRREAAQEVVRLLINNSNMTVAKYNTIRTGLESDQELKARFDQLNNGREQ
jgi:hypothetical protein